MKLGIIDWGIGGVGLLKKIREQSEIDIVYFSDTGYTPYGKVPEKELKERLNKVIRYLELNDCDHIAVACNAASTVLADNADCTGIIKPALELVKEMKIKRTGVVGGKRTIESEIYKNELKKSGIEAIQQIAQPLSARIEAGDLSSPELNKEIKDIFSPLKNEEYILLACTHYPVISKQILEFLPHIKLIDPATKMCELILNKMQSKDGNGHIKWMTSGNIHEMRNVLKKIYQIEANAIERNML